MSKIGVCIIGSAGAVASTVIAGTYLMRKGLVPRRGMITEKDPQFTKNVLPEMLPFESLDEFVFGGWDMHDVTYYDAVKEHGVVPAHLTEQVKGELDEKPWPAAVSEKFVVNLSGKNVIGASSFREETDIIIKQIEDFKAKHGLDKVVMVNLASTERYIEAGDVHATPEAFEAGLDASDERISPGMKYFYVAVKMGIPHCNFAPSLCRIPALETIAQDTGTPYCGMDGKTGQTLLKTTLAGMFRLRNIKVEGWYSANFLGNRDGLVLDDPGSNKTKIVSKASVLDSVVGYKVDNHQVHIHYYKPRGDAKEAWDNIDIEGFLGEMMQMKVNFLCKDSILAAPLVIDMVRLISLAKQKGEKGIQRQLSLFFKSPYADAGETPIHETFKQEDMLYAWVNKVKG